MRALLAAGLAGVCVAATGCGGSRPAPSHGILFLHGSASAVDGGDVYLWQAGSPPRRVVDTANLADDPAWSPDGRQVAFTLTSCHDEAECAAFSEIYVAHGDGSHERRLTSPASNEIRSVHPSWSPDGSRIVFERDQDDYARLAIVSARGGKAQLLDNPGIEPTWGKAGIAYLAGPGARIGAKARRWTIALLNPKTRAWKPFATPRPGYSFESIAWSSRGTLAALATHPGYGHPEEAAVYSGSGRLLSRFDLPGRARACGVAWSPGGTQLLLTLDEPRDPRAARRLYSVDPTGRHWRRLSLGLRVTSCNVSRR